MMMMRTAVEEGGAQATDRYADLTPPRNPCFYSPVPVAREKRGLIEDHLPLVQAIARKVKKTLSASIDFEDLVGYGSKGLVEAADRFDPTQGVSFSTFAYYRIRGAMFDGLRTMGWYSRSDYARYRAEERANQLLQAHADREAAERSALARQPAGASRAAEGPLDTATALASIGEILADVAAVHITSLDAAAGVADESLPAPDALIDTGRMGVRLRAAIQTLPERERSMMELYYYGGKNLEEAGATIGLSKSWACRLHARAIQLLRIALGDTGDGGGDGGGGDADADGGGGEGGGGAGQGRGKRGGSR
jgi:RNA polymerase sigma factor for flagellar operon FliA